MTSQIFNYHKLFFKRKQSSFNNKISSCTYYIIFNIFNYKIIEGSSYYHNYITMGYLYNYEVTKHYF